MPEYTVRNPATNQTVTFRWNGTEPPSDADIDEVFAEASAATPPPQSDVPDKRLRATIAEQLEAKGKSTGAATALMMAARNSPAAAKGATKVAGRFAANHPSATQKMINAGVRLAASGVGGATAGVPNLLALSAVPR